MHSSKFVIAAALLTVSAGALAGDASGTYMTFVRSMTDSKLPDGNYARLLHYYHAGTSDKADSPFAGKTSECVGRMIVSSAGKVMSGHGFCFSHDATGNGGSWTWKVTQAGTADCPVVCGTFKLEEGYGNTRSATASGKWKQTNASKEGGIGTYTVTFTP